ncbi:MAG: hypothetical protein JWQ07_988 [Ramlibacter sp.]|nr:hypothetical protein [Ramlibacter sp.]
MTDDQPTKPLAHYSIMAEYGGAYAWINVRGTQALGPMCADVDGWHGDHPISDALHKDFAAWQDEFERTGPYIHGSINRDAFHARGLALTFRLKLEIGDVARVFYCNDSASMLPPRVEVLLDGSIQQTDPPWRYPRSPPDWWPTKMISGGQTGVDRAALEWALRHGVAHGGWCPKGRLAADGAIPERFAMQETESAGYRQRTKLNVRDSDATLIINIGPLGGGTLLTKSFAEKMTKPCLVVQLDEAAGPEAADVIAQWLQENRFQTLNLAGPSEEKRPMIFAMTLDALNRSAQG